MALYNIPDAGSTAVNPPAAPANVYSGTLTPPAGTAGQQTSSNSGIGFTPSKLPTSVIQGIDNFGGGLGFGAPVAAPSASFVGPMPMGGALTSTPLSGVLTGAGIGGLVGSFNPLAKGSTVGQVGGMAGGAIGMAMGGPLGSAIGGFLGSSIGGIFGGKKKPGVKASEFQTNVGKANDFAANTGWGSKGADKSQAQGVHTDFTTYLNDIGTKYGLDFSNSSFRGGYNDQHAGGFFLNAKVNGAGGSIETDPSSWQNYNFDPSSEDKYKTYSQVAASMLASQGRMTKEISDALIKDTQDRLSSAKIGGAGLGGKEPMIPNAQPSGKENFNDFLTRYRSGNLDAGPVTSARDITPTTTPPTASITSPQPQRGLVYTDGKDYSPQGTPDDQKWKYNVGPKGPSGTPMGYM